MCLGMAREEEIMAIVEEYQANRGIFITIPVVFGLGKS